MRFSLSIVPLESPQSRDLSRRRARAAPARETDEQDTDLETVPATCYPAGTPIRSGSSRSLEGCSRHAACEVADALARRAARERLELSPELDAFVATTANRSFALQLPMPLVRRVVQNDDGRRPAELSSPNVILPSRAA
ncbi:hypothetical protein ACTGJ9_037070 [Bradyrhizobium sp. RDM12]